MGGKWTFRHAAILGATGPTGIALARVLAANGAHVRVISRSRAHLDRCFPGDDVEKCAADVAAGGHDLQSAIKHCDVVFDCVGLPGEQMHLHPVMARHLVAAIDAVKARCIKVASFWSYLPVVRLPLNEQHPRREGPPWTRWRREAEDVLRDAGAAVVNLPDFYGPGVHTSVLQQPLNEAAAGKTMNWIGRPDIPHEFVFVPDAMRLVAQLATFTEAYGENWIVPGAGSITGKQVAEIAGSVLGRRVGIRGAGGWMLRLVSLFNPELRGFMAMVPDYLQPITYDASKLKRLMGDLPATPYEEGIRQTLEWMASEAGRGD